MEGASSLEAGKAAPKAPRYRSRVLESGAAVGLQFPLLSRVSAP